MSAPARTEYCKTFYCNRHHRMSDGKPLNHSCRIIPPAALQAEQLNDSITYAEVLLRTPLEMSRGIVDDTPKTP